MRFTKTPNVHQHDQIQNGYIMQQSSQRLRWLLPGISFQIWGQNTGDNAALNAIFK